MMKKSVAFLVGVAFAFCLGVWCQPSEAQTYPTQLIQMVIPMAPGDTVDLSGRAIAAEMTKILKVPVVTINKPGGGSTIGANFVARAKKDGYTILFANSNIYYAHAMDPEAVPYDPLTDLEPLCLAVSVPLTIPVQTESPWKTFQELMDGVSLEDLPGIDDLYETESGKNPRKLFRGWFCGTLQFRSSPGGNGKCHHDDSLQRGIACDDRSFGRPCRDFHSFAEFDRPSGQSRKASDSAD
ncbi:MAG: tripartite tricarboxylate transporter substrate binding protein, partial [Deltaproteobacteria bacterium]|nr:tripartite tricarboxylate transporter substrate binding protein [Deltaproteobacteria bacterium]